MIVSLAATFSDVEVLLAKHTYNAAPGKYLIPRRFSEDNEMPQATAEREVLEDTDVTVKGKSTNS